jgi:hypothetical protein
MGCEATVVGAAVVLATTTKPAVAKAPMTTTTKERPGREETGKGKKP